MNFDIEDYQENKPNTPEKDYGAGMVKVLNFFAYLILVLGIIGALYFWIYVGYEVDKHYSRNDINPIGIVYTLMTLFSSILTFVLLRVVVVIANNSIEIRKKLCN
jgi:uncharacterized Tic20 family protein